MKQLRRVALSLTVVFALTAAGTSAASGALPEFVSGEPHGFESLLKTTKLETVGKALIICKRGFDFGEVTGPKTLAAKIILMECSIPGALCTSPGAKPGEILTATLSGTLGYIHKPTKVVGLDLSAPAPPFTTFFCAATAFVVEGSVIGKITPVNKPLIPGEHFTLKFAQKAGKQSPKKFEGGPIDVLATSINAGPFEGSGLAASDELFFAGPLEIKA